MGTRDPLHRRAGGGEPDATGSWGWGKRSAPPRGLQDGGVTGELRAAGACSREGGSRVGAWLHTLKN